MKKTSHTLKDLTKLIMHQAKEKGFGTKPEEINVPEKIALIHSEISEAYEAYRNKKIEGRNGFKEEMGDAIQRILHLAGTLGIDIEEVIIKKIKKNKGRKWNWEKLNEKHV
ncbi:MAG TPA: MazG nucleotide pyrophosphohydrolase domain-containing protein [Patescibacteria group bacterium]|nr:MazG nucleotide pyrophosphohydrolase domain-containing protein [Patescibacteria group bacterium]